MTCRFVESDCKHATERRRRGFDLTIFCTNYWRPGIVVPADFCLRPAPKQLAEALGYSPRFGPDGYEYFATVLGGGPEGQSGRKEPRFDANPVTDGSLIWTRRAVSALSLYRTVLLPLNIQWIAPTEMTVDAPESAISSVVQIAAFHAGGTAGDTHRVIARVPFSDGTIEDFGLDWTITGDDD